MKITIVSVGKQHETYVKEGIELYVKRIQHYYPIDFKLLAADKQWNSLDINTQKQKETELILKNCAQADCIVLLDEKGKLLNSIEFAELIQTKANNSIKNITFIIGGAYGVGDELFKKADFVLSLSKMVFPHQLVRLILVEQIYRACSIIHNQKYHHQ